MLTQEILKQHLSYDPGTGLFRWIKNRGQLRKMGNIAGCYVHGYIGIRVLNGRRHGAHRLAWLYVYGEWPAFDIDHINGIKHDNRICNLREATRQQNTYNRKAPINNTSGYKGVSWHKSTGKWRATIKYKGKYRHLGTYNSPQEAHARYVAFAEAIAGDFLHESLKKTDT